MTKRIGPKTLLVVLQKSLVLYLRIVHQQQLVVMYSERFPLPLGVGAMLDELEWPFLEDRRGQSSLAFFYKIHSGTVSLDKDKYLTPVPNIRSTRASHEFQYTRYLVYSEALTLKNSFFPRTIPVRNSLPSSVVSSKTPEEFKALI